MAQEIRTGLSHEVRDAVTAANTAKAMGSASTPPSSVMKAVMHQPVRLKDSCALSTIIVSS